MFLERSTFSMDSNNILKHNLLTKLALAATLSLGFVASANINKPNILKTVQAAHKGDIKDGKFHYLYKNHKGKTLAALADGEFYVYNNKGKKINITSWDENVISNSLHDKYNYLLNDNQTLTVNGYKYINGQKFWHLKADKDEYPEKKNLYMKASNFNARTNKIYGHPGYVIYQTSRPVKCYLQESPDENGHVEVTDSDYEQTIPSGGTILIDTSPFTTNYKRETNKDVVYASTSGSYDLTHQEESMMIKKSDWDKYVHVAPDNVRYYSYRVSNGYMTNGLLKKGYIVSAYNGKKMKMYRDVWNFNVVSDFADE